MHTNNRTTTGLQPQNCELKQEERWVGLELFRNSGFEVIFCFNSKPNFSFESTGQHTSFPVASAYRFNRKKNRFRVKTAL